MKTKYSIMFKFCDNDLKKYEYIGNLSNMAKARKEAKNIMKIYKYGVAYITESKVHVLRYKNPGVVR